MAEGKADFFVIYNRALNPKAETDDTELSLAFVKDLVKFLESKGHKGLYDDRDSKPGSNVFEQLRKNVGDTKKTMLVVSPEFLRNCWATYSGQYAFMQLLDSQETGKLVPIGIDITDHQKLQELNIIDWVHFTKDWAEEQNRLRWDVIAKVFEQDGPLSGQPAYQKYKYAQEHGDNRLRTDNDALVVQEAHREFLTDKFFANLGENFANDWEFLALKLGVKDKKVEQVKVNNPRNVTMQAFKALLSWKESQAGSEEEKVTDLQAVLNEMGRKDLKQKIEKEYKEFTKSEDSNQGAEECFDEVDMGMSRPGNRFHPVGKRQKDSVKVQPGPSLTLPPPAVQQPRSQCGLNIVEKESHEDQKDGKDSIDGPINHEPKVEQHISATNCQGLNVKRPDVRPPLEQISNATGNNLENQISDKKYNSQQSLSKDNDLSADVDVSFSLKRPVSSVDKPAVTKPSNQNVNQSDQDEPSLNNSPDSGCYSHSETPINEQTIANENKSPQMAKKFEEKVDQSEENKRYQSIGSESNKRYQSVENESNKRNQPLESEKNKGCQHEGSEENKRYQPVGSEENKRYQPVGSAGMAKNQTGQEWKRTPQVVENAIASCQLGVEQANSMQGSMNDCNSDSRQVNGELDSTQQPDQGQSPKTTSLASRFFTAVCSALLKPELVYYNN